MKNQLFVLNLLLALPLPAQEVRPGAIRVFLECAWGCDFYGNFGLVHNQVELANGGATPQEVYLRVRQLKTNYNYYVWCGASYTFGSIYSNVVNPRFGDGF